MNPRHGGWLIGLSVVVAMTLAAFQVPFVPNWLGWLRPEWGVVLFFFWTVEAPSRTGVVSAWLAGLFFDVLLDAPLGSHGIGFAATTYLTARFQSRLAMRTLAQRAIVVFGMVTAVGLLNATIGLLVRGDFVWRAPLAGIGAAIAYPVLAVAMSGVAAKRLRS